jgi:formamidopyrimidine-DNA glycosylase
MVEGHQVQRLAHRHRQKMVGVVFRACSPNQRFEEGAKRIDGSRLAGVEAVGKNLFYFFESKKEKGTVVMAVHFGMAGRFATMNFPGTEPTPTTRLRLVCEEKKLVAHLSAMTVLCGGEDLYLSKRQKLGEDPLREDADPERVWKKLQKTHKPVGLMLMDQSCISGIGNIYRAEILFKSGVHPEQPSSTLTREEFETIWKHSVLLLQRGFLTGSILTVDEEEELPPPWTRRYIYNHSVCPRCRGPVSTWDMASRTVHACTRCQPLRAGQSIAPARQKALRAASPSRLFLSHCAPEDVAVASLRHLTVAQLQERLRAHSLPVTGRKTALIARLEETLGAGTSTPADKASGGDLTPRPTTATTGSKVRIPSWANQVIKPGTLHLQGGTVEGQRAAEDDLDGDDEGGPTIATALEAALEKERAGESRAVEHVALVEDDLEESLLQKKKKSRR